MYSETVKEHFKNPRNVGEMDNADGVGEVGNPICGDMMKIFIKVHDEQIEDIKFQTCYYLETRLKWSNGGMMRQ